MKYLTYYKTKQHNYTQLDLFDLIYNDENIRLNNVELSYPVFQTIQTNAVKETPFILEQLNRLKMYLNLLATNSDIQTLINSDITTHYYSFRIPKAKGGFRTIEAPDDTLKLTLTNIKNTLQNYLNILPHNAAFAYIPKRCAKLALEKHQHNKSKHFLHLDLKDFFTSCNAEFIHKQLKQIFPFSEIYNDPNAKKGLDLLVNLALKEDHLPQGTPLSPYLTNIIMIPIDYKISQLCKQFNKQHLVYTRYADDIDISSKYNFKYSEVMEKIEEILAETPLKINKNKVHYGTTAGRNWHLGLLINQENKISLGRNKKREIKKELLSYCLTKETWEKKDYQRLLGILAYFKNIEPEYCEYVVKTYSNKYNENKDILNEIIEKIKRI